MNISILSGRLTTDPEIRHMTDGRMVARFTIAVDKALNSEKKREFEAAGKPTADFVRCSAFGKTAELIASNLIKGKRLMVQGSISTGSYQNKEGKTVFTTEVVADRVEIIDWPERVQDGAQSAGEVGHQEAMYPDTGSMIPF